MRNANTNASQLCVIPIILPLCRLPFPWFFTIWVFFWTVFCPFLALLLCLMVCMFLCPGGFCLLVWVPLGSVCPILGGCVCSWTLTTFWMVRVTPPARSSLPLGWVKSPYPLPSPSYPSMWHAFPNIPFPLTYLHSISFDLPQCDKRFSWVFMSAFLCYTPHQHI